MYISADQVKQNVVVWERHEHGREVKQYMPPYYFYVRDPKGPHTTIYGDPCTKITFKDRVEMNNAVSRLKHSIGEVAREQDESEKDLIYSHLFETDISPLYRVLSREYYNAEVPDLHITFFDIEVDYDETKSFSSTSNPYAPINSIALEHFWSKEKIVLCVPPDDSWTDPEQLGKDPVGDQMMCDMAEIIFCRNEKDLLRRFLNLIDDSDILCGWNSDAFDIPYIALRVLKVLDEKTFDEDATDLDEYCENLNQVTRAARNLRKMDFREARNPKWRVYPTNFGTKMITLDTTGRVRLDYMELFKKYEMAERPSYKLESISEEQLKDLPKLEYEGSLAKLYKNNFPFFIRYNIRDTEILSGLEEKLGYVGLANTMVHISTATFPNVLGTLKLAELAINNYCHHELNLVVPNTNPPDVNVSIQGAFVLTPKAGMHDNIGSIDINSLYPNSIQSINISPETLIGQFIEKVVASDRIAENSDERITLVYKDGRDETKPASEWREICLERKWAVSGYGTIYSQETKGIIPAILEGWYATRKKYQKLKKNELQRAHECEDKGDDEGMKEAKRKAGYYDRLQYVYKIKLNSLYGALSNQYFRYFNAESGESTTGTGRKVLMHQCAEVNRILSGEYNPEGDSIIYGDTDSSYFATGAHNSKEAILIADRVGELVNDSFKEFMQRTFLCHPGFDEYIKAGREIVADRGIFVQKKRYILHVIDNEGETVDKLKTMGLELKKTTLPKPIQIKLSSFIERLLKGEDWNVLANDIIAYSKELTNTEDLSLIGLPKGVKKVDEYTFAFKAEGDKARLPAHIAGSIFYNMMLDRFDDKESLRIMSGMKIKVYILTRKFLGKFNKICLPTDIEIVPDWFKENFVPLIDRQAHVERLVEGPLDNIIKAIGRQTPTPQRMFVEDVLEF